jgi:hypothetical protein
MNEHDAGAGRSTILMLLILAFSAVVAPADAQDRFDGGRRSSGRVNISLRYAPFQIIVSSSDRRLYHVKGPGRAVSYSIATPRDQSLWRGTELVTAKRERPAWRPTSDMLKESPRLPSFVPGGHPLNPMGARALYLGGTYYRIHGTDAPWTIGQNVSKGCIRMLNADVIELYENTPVGAKVTVTSESLTARLRSYRQDDRARERERDWLANARLRKIEKSDRRSEA